MKNLLSFTTFFIGFIFSILLLFIFEIPIFQYTTIISLIGLLVTGIIDTLKVNK
jgi:hypothetical protein